MAELTKLGRMLVEYDLYQNKLNMAELTFGQKRVRVNFNPSANYKVEHFKKRIAAMIDEMNELAQSTDDHETRRLCSIAMTELEGSAMWAVKALTA